MKWLAGIAVGLVYLFHALVLLFAHKASVVTSVLLFATLGALCAWGLVVTARCFGWSRDRRIGLVVAAASLFATLAVVDVYLHYGVGHYATYHERIGGWFSEPTYRTPFTQWLTGLWSASPTLHVRAANRRGVHRQPEFSYETMTNAEGIPDRDHTLRKPPGVFRIVTLGDSFTAGMGAGFEFGWPKQVERILDRSRPNLTVEIIGGGVVGSDALYAYRLLEDRLLAYDPDAVILAINGSDIRDLLIRGGMERFTRDGGLRLRKGPSWQWIYAASYIVRHVVHDVLGYDALFLTKAERAKSTERALEDLYLVCGLLEKLARNRDLALLIVIHPLAHEISAREMELRPLVEKIRQAGGPPTLDLLPYFTETAGVEETNLDQYYWPIDTHHTPAGYRVMAEGIAGHIESLGWLQARR